ncbi:MAG: lysophospholipid acyltransferase family protein [Alphaproteobacteria bacterium]|nr:lysophospholipid acyltransferase family protein [Alphaproteobacteria bacterium]
MRILKTLAAKPWFRTILGRLIAGYIALVWRTARWTVEGAHDHVAAWEGGRPLIVCFWHGRLLMLPMAWRRGVAFRMLISSHRDGRIIADAMRHVDIGTLAGSTRRGGAEVMRLLLRTLRGGTSIGITPDGPRGPRMRASAGVVAMARLSGAPMIPLAYSTTRRRVLGTWDRFLLPLPFGRGTIVWGKAIHVPADADEAAAERYRLEIEAAINAVTAQADRSCGHPPIEPGPPIGAAEALLRQ